MWRRRSSNLYWPDRGKSRHPYRCKRPRRLSVQGPSAPTRSPTCSRSDRASGPGATRPDCRNTNHLRLRLAPPAGAVLFPSPPVCSKCPAWPSEYGTGWVKVPPVSGLLAIVAVIMVPSATFTQRQKDFLVVAPRIMRGIDHEKTELAGVGAPMQIHHGRRVGVVPTRTCRFGRESIAPAAMRVDRRRAFFFHPVHVRGNEQTVPVHVFRNVRVESQARAARARHRARMQFQDALVDCPAICALRRRREHEVPLRHEHGNSVRSHHFQIEEFPRTPPRPRVAGSIRVFRAL